jgi:hypothetical protein
MYFEGFPSFNIIEQNSTKINRICKKSVENRIKILNIIKYAKNSKKIQTFFKKGIAIPKSL